MYNTLNLQNKSLEEVFKVAFEKNVAPTAIFNLDTTIAMVNDAYCEVSGYTREEVVGMSWTKQLPPEELVRLAEYNQLRLTDPDKAPSHYEFTFFTKQGELKYGHTQIATLLSHELLIMSFTDVTENKRNELLIAKQNEELKDLIAKRDKDLTLSISQLINYGKQVNTLVAQMEELKTLAQSEAQALLPAVNDIIGKLSKQQRMVSWVNLNKMFQISYPEFLTNILHRHAALTPAEIKLCALLRLNLDTKEIATILNISFNSIRIARGRLRKKLNLTTDENLVAYLMQFK